MIGRAETPEQKRAILDKIYSMWLQHPELRLGQLLLNAHSVVSNHKDFDIFYVEDETLVEELKQFCTVIQKSADRRIKK
jgi:hypothetical protein